MIIKKLPAADQPVFKILDNRIGELSDSELLAVIIGNGTRGVNAIDIGRMIINKFYGIANITKLDLPELCAIKGINKKKASKILAAIELSRRVNNKADQIGIRLDYTEKIFEYMRHKFKGYTREALFVLFLNHSLHLKFEMEFSTGTDNEIIIYVRELIRIILKSNYSNIILVHNHLEKLPVPTSEDLRLTKEIRERCRYFDINLLDHIVVGEQGYCSLMETAIRCRS
ncbi:MAG: hypothetical protein A2096_01375 [Spirochaetes bacterium GWF1_41_5]|nr:MAG: hypothetical protein A2096_01375 [Spirochaetes bacterium GWF1_41_5]HBE02002.1 hypothetical protein [Spirochaetia bacterium]